VLFDVFAEMFVHLSLLYMQLRFMVDSLSLYIHVLVLFTFRLFATRCYV